MASQEQPACTPINMNPNQSQPVLHPPKQQHPKQQPPQNTNNNSHNKSYRKKPFNSNSNYGGGYPNGYPNGGGYHGNGGGGYYSRGRDMSKESYYKTTKNMNYQQRPYNQNSMTNESKYNSTGNSSAGNSSATNSTTPPTPTSSTNNSASTVASPSSNLASPNASSLNNVSGENANVDATNSHSPTEENIPQVDEQPEPPRKTLIETNDKAMANNLARDLANMQLNKHPNEKPVGAYQQQQPAHHHPNASSTMSFKSHSPHEMSGGKPLATHNSYQGSYHSYGRPRYSQSGKIYGDKSYGDKPYGDKSYGDKPYGEKSYGDKSYGDKSYGDKSYGDKTYGDKSYGPGSYSNNSGYQSGNYNNSRNNSGSGNYQTYPNKLGSGGGGGYKKQNPALLSRTSSSSGGDGKPNTLNQSNQPNHVVLKNGQPTHHPLNRSVNTAAPSSEYQMQQMASLHQMPMNTALFYQSGYPPNASPAPAGQPHQLNQSQGAQPLPNLPHANCFQCFPQNAYGQPFISQPHAYPSFYPASAQFIATNSMPYQYNAMHQMNAGGEPGTGIQQQPQPQSQATPTNANQQPNAGGPTNAGPTNTGPNKPQQTNYIRPAYGPGQYVPVANASGDPSARQYAANTSSSKMNEKHQQLNAGKKSKDEQYYDRTTEPMADQMAADPMAACPPQFVYAPPFFFNPNYYANPYMANPYMANPYAMAGNPGESQMPNSILNAQQVFAIQQAQYQQANLQAGNQMGNQMANQMGSQVNTMPAMTPQPSGQPEQFAPTAPSLDTIASNQPPGLEGGSRSNSAYDSGGGAGGGLLQTANANGFTGGDQLNAGGEFAYANYATPGDYNAMLWNQNQNLMINTELSSQANLEYQTEAGKQATAGKK